MTPKDLFQSIVNYILECCVYDHTFAFAILLPHKNLLRNITLCCGSAFSLNGKKNFKLGARFVYIYIYIYVCVCVCVCVYIMRYLDMTFWRSTILYKGGTIKPEDFHSTCKLTIPAMSLYRYTRFYPRRPVLVFGYCRCLRLSVRPYGKMMIFKLCNILLWIGNNYYKTAAESHYITFSVIIQWFLVPVPLLLDGLVFSLVKNANLRKKYFPFIKSRFVKKVSGHHPLPLEFLKSTQISHYMVFFYT